MKRWGARGRPSPAGAVGRLRGQSLHCAPAAGVVWQPQLPALSRGAVSRALPGCSCTVIQQRPPCRGSPCRHGQPCLHPGSPPGRELGQPAPVRIDSPSLGRSSSFFGAAPKGGFSRRLSLTPALAMVPLGPAWMLFLLAGGMWERGVAQWGKPLCRLPCCWGRCGHAVQCSHATWALLIPCTGSMPGRAAPHRSIPAPQQGCPAGQCLCCSFAASHPESVIFK